MTLVSIGSNQMIWPGLIRQPSGAISLAADTTLDAATEYFCYVGIAEQDMVITHVHGRFSQTGTGNAIASIQAIDGATGFPSGNGFGSTASVGTNITNAAWNTIALQVAATVPRGSVFGIQVLYNSGTTVVVQRVSSLNNVAWQLPYFVSNITGSPVKARLTGTTTLSCGPSSTTTYSQTGTIAANALTGGTFNNTTTDRKRGMAVTLPFRARITGVQWYNSTAVGDYSVVVEDSSGAELSSSSTAIEGDLTVPSAAALHAAYFDNQVTLNAGTLYRVMVVPSSATNVNVQALQANNATYITASFPGMGAALYSTATVTPVYTDNTDQVPLMDLILDRVDDGGRAPTYVLGI